MSNYWCLDKKCLTSVVPFKTAKEAAECSHGEQVKAPSGASGDKYADDLAIQTLKQLSIQFKHFEHPSASTVEIWRPFCEKNAPNALICKNLFLKDKKKNLVLVSALATTTVDLKILEKQLKMKNPRLAPEDVLNGVLNLASGSVTPFACKADVENQVIFVLDKDMIEAGKSTNLLFHPLSGNSSSVEISSANLLRYFDECKTSPKIIDFEN
eukprot:m.29594 g.29594  ORF g.29594 m.29594 type:complete len:212 (+) comp16129_c0_seq1:150-785(+)